MCFSLSDCSFVPQKSRETTARLVVARQLGVRLSYTLETTFCGPDFGTYRNCIFTTRHLEMAGLAMCQGISDFFVAGRGTQVSALASPACGLSDAAAAGSSGRKRASRNRRGRKGSSGHTRSENASQWGRRGGRGRSSTSAHPSIARISGGWLDHALRIGPRRAPRAPRQEEEGSWLAAVGCGRGCLGRTGGGISGRRRRRPQPCRRWGCFEIARHAQDIFPSTSLS